MDDFQVTPVRCTWRIRGRHVVLSSTPLTLIRVLSCEQGGGMDALEILREVVYKDF